MGSQGLNARISSLPCFLAIILASLSLSPAYLYAAPSASTLDSGKFEKVYTAEDQGLSFTAAGNSVTTDMKVIPQSAISIVAIPWRAKVVKAFLYWSGEVLAVSSADTSVDLILPGGKIRKVYADEVGSTLKGGLLFSCRADVTDSVRSDGVYRIKELDLDPVRDRSGPAGGGLGSWSLVIVYKIPGFPSRSRVTVYDSLDEGTSAIEEGNLKTRIGPALIVEKRPPDVLYFLKKGDDQFSSGSYARSLKSYGAAITRSPVFAVLCIVEVRMNRVVAAIQRGGHLLKPFLVKANSVLAVFFIAYALLLNLIYLILTLIAAHLAGEYLDEDQSVRQDAVAGRNRVLPISILISAYNEEQTIGRTLGSVLRLKYPEYEVIVVNDGSKDQTLEVLKQEYALREHVAAVANTLPAYGVRAIYRSQKFPHLYVIDKKNSGKADSLNAGLNLSHCPLFCTIDADTILEEDALFRLALPILKEPEEVVGTTGMIRVRNGCTAEGGVVVRREVPGSFLAVMQVLEYIRAYSIGRIGWDLFNAHVIVSGAFSLYRKDLVVRLGGYHRYAIGEDVELNMRIHKALLEEKQRYKIVYVLGARCLTQAPVDFKSLARQRNRWQQGLMTAVRLNTRTLFNPRYGYLGMLAVPFYALLEMPAPLLELFGYVLMPLFALFDMLSVKYMLILLGLVMIYGSGLSFLAVLLDRRYFKFYDRRSYRRLFWHLLSEGFGFHQLTVFWRLKGIVDYLKEVHVREMGWRSPERLKVA